MRPSVYERNSNERRGQTDGATDAGQRRPDPENVPELLTALGGMRGRLIKASMDVRP